MDCAFLAARGAQYVRAPFSRNERRVLPGQNSIYLPQGFCKCFSSCLAATKSCAFSVCCDDLRLSERCALKWLGFASEWSVQSREARTEQREVRSTGTRINGTWAVFSEWTEWAVLRAKAEKKKKKEIDKTLEMVNLPFIHRVWKRDPEMWNEI